jgi:hypothetical protein
MTTAQAPPPESQPQQQQPPSRRDAKADAKAAKAHTKALRPWYKKKRWILSLGLILLIGIASVGSSSEDGTSPPTADAPKATPQSDEPSPAPAAPAAPAEPAEPELTSGQENALESGQSYVDMSGFSKQGLIQQLSSSAGEGFSKADAVFAANHVDVNWNDEAVESAQDYLDMSSFSRDGLIEQLSSSAGEGFTLAQAQYAADKVY